MTRVPSTMLLTIPINDIDVQLNIEVTAITTIALFILFNPMLLSRVSFTIYPASLQVHLVSEHIWCDDYLVRSFYLKNLQTNETRTVTQFHFLTWPDLGVPTSAKSLLDFRRYVVVKSSSRSSGLFCCGGFVARCTLQALKVALLDCFRVLMIYVLRSHDSERLIVIWGRKKFKNEGLHKSFRIQSHVKFKIEDVYKTIPRCFLSKLAE